MTDTTLFCRDCGALGNHCRCTEPVCVPPVVPHQFQHGVCVWCGAPAEGDDE
jgi:hypothetical protein